MRDLFPGYYRYTNNDMKILWSECIFVFDASALLNLYEFSVEGLEQYFKTLDHIKDRLWLPYHFAWEYQRGRQKVIRNQNDFYNSIRKNLDIFLNDIEKKRKISLHHFDIDGLKHKIKDIKVFINDIQEKRPNRQERDIIREKLDDLFQGRVGNPYTEQEYQVKERVAAWRVERHIPPGYEDINKSLGNMYGDVIAWFQILDYAASTGKSIIFITDDVKNDWWIDKNDPTQGPKSELRQEMNQVAQQNFYAYTSDLFLKAVGKYLEFDQSTKLIDEAQKIREDQEDQYRIKPSTHSLMSGHLSDFAHASGIFEGLSAADQFRNVAGINALAAMDQLRNVTDIGGMFAADQLRNVADINALAAMDQLRNVAGINALAAMDQFRNATDINGLAAMDQLRNVAGINALAAMDQLRNATDIGSMFTTDQFRTATDIGGMFDEPPAVGKLAELDSGDNLFISKHNMLGESAIENDKNEDSSNLQDNKD